MYTGSKDSGIGQGFAIIIAAQITSKVVKIMAFVPETERQFE
jgi:hypothetical protein